MRIVAIAYWKRCILPHSLMWYIAPVTYFHRCILSLLNFSTVAYRHCWILPTLNIVTVTYFRMNLVSVSANVITWINLICSRQSLFSHTQQDHQLLEGYGSRQTLFIQTGRRVKKGSFQYIYFHKEVCRFSWHCRSFISKLEVVLL